MKAIVFDRPGEPREVVELRDVPAPTPKPGQVLVRMIASPINPSDLLNVAGHYTTRPEDLPAVAGFEGVGVVERSGGGLLGWLRKGRRVAVISDRGGCWAEYVVVPARHVVPVPADIPDEQAASFFVNPATALAMTEHVLRVSRGEWLLQSAAASALGRMIVRLGKRSGFRTMNVVRRAEQADDLRKIGADEVVVAEGAAITGRVMSLTDGKGVRFAIDPVGGDTGSAVLASLGAGGKALLYGLLSGQPVSLDPRLIITTGVRIEGFWLGGWAKHQNVVTLLRLFRRIGQLMRAGVLVTDKVASFPVVDFRAAIAVAMSPATPGKVLLRF